MCSSGTSSGEPKMMPSIAEDLERRTFVYNLITPIINQLIIIVTSPHLFLFLLGLDYALRLLLICHTLFFVAFELIFQCLSAVI